MLDQGNAQLSAVGFYNPAIGEPPVGEFFGGAPGSEAPAQPYEVQWDQSLDGGAGAWKVYLPAGHLLAYGQEYVDTSDFDGVTEIRDESGGTSWFALDDVGRRAGHVYLVVTVDYEGGAVEARLGPSTGSEDPPRTRVYNICVAELSYRDPAEAGGAPETKVKQSLVGALALGEFPPDPPDPDDVSLEPVPAASGGEEPAGDEGKWQIKGFKAGLPADPNTLADYLQEGAELPEGGITLVCRVVDGEDGPVLKYLPLAALSRPTEPREYIGGVRYDLELHQLQQRVMVENVDGTVVPKAGAGYDNGWTMIENGQAVPHSGEA